MEKAPWHVGWSEDLSVGIPEIDAEHRTCLSLVDELNGAIIDRGHKQDIERICAALVLDAAHHFGHEERLLAELGYPEASHHAQLHKELTAKIAAAIEQLRSTEQGRYWAGAALSIKSALLDHLLQEDMKFRDYFLSRRASP